MNNWWKRRSLKLSLTLWYAAATSVVLGVFAWVDYEVVQHRLAAVELEQGLHVRVMERPARVREHGVIVRQFRDETEMRRTLRQIVEVFLLALPLAVALASAAGYWVAQRSLRPVAAMGEPQSLAERILNEYSVTHPGLLP